MEDPKFTELVKFLEEEQQKLKEVLKDLTYIDPWHIIDNTEMMTLADFALESIVPACCKHECNVEPDGYCEHGNPSILIELKVI